MTMENNKTAKQTRRLQGSSFWTNLCPYLNLCDQRGVAEDKKVQK